MLREEFPVQLDDSMTRAAVLAAFFGAFAHHFLGWTTVGWTVIVLSLLMLWLAHQFAIAPLWDEPESPD